MGWSRKPVRPQGLRGFKSLPLRQNQRSMRRLKEFLLNTPEKYWLVVYGDHLHKSFWGLALFLTGFVLTWYVSLFGMLVLSLSVAGHVYTRNRPYLKLW